MRVIEHNDFLRQPSSNAPRSRHFPLFTTPLHRNAALRLDIFPPLFSLVCFPPFPCRSFLCQNPSEFAFICDHVSRQRTTPLGHPSRGGLGKPNLRLKTLALTLCGKSTTYDDPDGTSREKAVQQTLNHPPFPTSGPPSSRLHPNRSATHYSTTPILHFRPTPFPTPFRVLCVLLRPTSVPSCSTPLSNPCFVRVSSVAKRP